MQEHELLSHFNQVYKTSKEGSYHCLCPAHDDRHPSLAIRFLPDGRILLHCFAGCDIESILQASHLTFNDILPSTRIDDFKPPGKLFNPYAILKTLKHEALFVYMCAREIEQGRALQPSDQQKLLNTLDLVKEAFDYAQR